LVRRCLSGTPDAFRELFDRYARRILGTAHRITGNAADAEDVLQEVFLKVHRKLGGFGFRSTFSLWIHRIAVNESINWKSRRPRAPEPQPPAPEGDAMSLLDRLTPPLRAVMTLRYVSGFSYDEIAELLDIPAGTVKSRLFEAHAKLREEGS
jgi:RNA polymerase sigma-70 factor (ECF subfamily)